jgi:hypothetical protein
MGCLVVKGGCGGVHVLADPTEQLVVEAVLSRLESHAFASQLGHLLGEEAGVLAAAERLAEIKAHRAQVCDDYARRLVDRDTWLAMMTTISEEEAEAEQVAGRPRPSVVLGDLGEDVREGWDRLGEAGAIDRQRAILAMVLKEVRIDPITEGPRNVFRPERVHLTWAA